MGPGGGRGSRGKYEGGFEVIQFFHCREIYGRRDVHRRVAEVAEKRGGRGWSGFEQKVTKEAKPGLGWIGIGWNLK